MPATVAFLDIRCQIRKGAGAPTPIHARLAQADK
jgi:hypothetical protein